MEEQSRSNSGKKEDPLNVCFAELPVLVVLNKLVKTLGKKSNLKFGLI
jgi:hypothetical protein